MGNGTSDDLATLRAMRSRAVLGGGQKRIEQQHARGKLTARERLDRLYDPGTFLELGMFAKHRCEALAGKDIPGDGVVVGSALISKIEANLDDLDCAKREIVELLTSMRHAMDA